MNSYDFHRLTAFAAILKDLPVSNTIFNLIECSCHVHSKNSKPDFNDQIDCVDGNKHALQPVSIWPSRLDVSRAQ